jgi:hypothetical protein
MSKSYANCVHNRVRYSHVHHNGVEGCTMSCCRVCIDCGSPNFYRDKSVFCLQPTGWLAVDEERDLEHLMTYSGASYEQAASVYHNNNRDLHVTMLQLLGKDE